MLELLIIIIVVVVAVVLLLRWRGSDSPPPPAAADSAAVGATAIAPAGAGNELTTRLAFLAPRDSVVRAGDTVTVRLQATTESGTAVARATIAVQVTEGGGQLSAASGVTGDNGEVEVRWMLGAAAGPQTVRATVDGSETATATLTLATTAAPAGAE